VNISQDWEKLKKQKQRTESKLFEMKNQSASLLVFQQL